VRRARLVASLPGGTWGRPRRRRADPVAADPLLDVVDSGSASSHEWPETATTRDQHAAVRLSALWAGFGRRRLRRRPIRATAGAPGRPAVRAGKLPGLFMLRILRAARTRRTAQPDHHGWPSEHTSSDGRVVKSARRSSLVFPRCARGTDRRNRALPDQARLPLATSSSSSSMRAVNSRSRTRRSGRPAGPSLSRPPVRMEPALLHLDVAAIHDRRDRGRVRRRPTDAVLLESLDQVASV